MRPSNEVLEFILERFDYYLAYPASYAPTPDALEQVLIDLDKVRLYLCGQPHTDLLIRFRGQYYDFLNAHQHDVALFTTWHRSGDTKKDFRDLCDFWQLYLAQSTPPVHVRKVE